MTDASVDAATLQQLAGKLLELLKIRTLPIAMKQYTSREEMEKVKGLRWPMEGRRPYDLPTCHPVAHGGVHAGHRRR